VFEGEADAASPVANHLFHQSRDRSPGMIGDREFRSEPTAQTGGIDAMVELDIFASVEPFIEKPDGLENRSAIGHRHTARLDEPSLGRVDVRRRIVP
jgi:hypothetical protein